MFSTIPNLEPQHTVRPTQRRPSAKRRIRNWILFIILIVISAIWIVIGFERYGRHLPFIEKEAPPITGMHPLVAAKTKELKTEMDKLGISIIITDDFRSHVDQNALYEKGRTASGPIVTYAKGGQSYHNYGLAVDFALKTKKGKIVWDMEYDGNLNGKADWMEVVAVAKKLGFSWGGDWEGFKDYPHLQMDFGYSVGELSRGFRPPATDETANGTSNSQ
ncbi:M15 family metallopeptidase [Paenibacillus sp. GCM10027627]|uniref:M15 family metallopeptidase n=1 Tax=unclassified Paenibacillus TaxID=185978 RepID=UPI00363DA00F